MGPIARKVTGSTISRECSLVTSTRRLIILLCIASLAGLGVTMSAGSELLGNPRVKRNGIQLCWIINHHTDRSCLNYDTYGCYCGPGLSATVDPVDEVDNCCRLHDDCYGTLSNHCYWWWFAMVVAYTYECTDASCTCTDSPTDSQCYYHTCQCDLMLGQCLQNATFHQEFYNYNRTLCGES